MTLNGVMAVTLRYFTEFGTENNLWRNLCKSLLYFSACTMSSQRKFTFAILSPDEFLVDSVTAENCCLPVVFIAMPRWLCYSLHVAINDVAGEWVYHV